MDLNKPLKKEYVKQFFLSCAEVLMLRRISPPADNPPTCSPNKFSGRREPWEKDFSKDYLFNKVFFLRIVEKIIKFSYNLEQLAEVVPQLTSFWLELEYFSTRFRGK